MDRLTPDATIVDTSKNSFSSRQEFDVELPRQLIDMRILELLTARLCHELSGPIAAINNGVELLAEEDPGVGSLANPAFLSEAVTLVSDSARRARSRLQFYRFVYGFTSGSAIAGPAPHEIAVGLFAESRIATDYAESIRVLSPDWQKLACNMLSVGAAALPRGGRLILTDAPLTVEALGDSAALSADAREALVLAVPIAALTARTVQPYFTGLLAKALETSIDAMADRGRVRLSVVSPRSG
jgi:histidine phosphotransferase ChpT